MRTQQTYFMGLIKKSANTVILQMRRDKDYLSCELWQYYGERITTKTHQKLYKQALLQAINKTYNKSFTHILID